MRRNVLTVGLAFALVLALGGIQAVQAAECSEGTKVSEGCDGYTYEGCCDAAGATLWCDTPTGPTCMIDCAADGAMCGWKGSFYGCGDTEEADPTGAFPRACASCDPACAANQWCNVDVCEDCSCGAMVCGTDQCGNSCGTCAEGTLCNAEGACVTPPTCVEAYEVVCDQSVMGDTSVDGTNVITAYPGCDVEETGPEMVFKFIPATDDKLQITLDSAVDVDVLVLTDACWGENCVYGGDEGFPWWDVTAGTQYFLVIDGYGGEAGSFNFTVECLSTCVPDCTDKTCGDDGCGGSCGECLGQCVGNVCYLTDGCDPVHQNGEPGCSGCACEACVCAADDWCCSNEWDGLCAEQCISVCDGCGILDNCGDSICLGAEHCGNCDQDCACAAGQVCAVDTCCTPKCAGKECGDDGCGGSCGTCDAGFLCNAGMCEACVPACDGKECGDDGCGGSCGTCAAGEECSGLGKCDEPGNWPTNCQGTQAPVSDDCMGATYEGCCNNGITYWCENNALYCIDCPANGAQCGWSDQGYYDCTEDGLADPSGANPKDCPNGGTCTPNCTDKECGSDGCGGQCGTCAEGSTCNAMGKCETGACVPSCDGKECGDDGCEGFCGTCSDGKSCEAGVCVGGDIPTPDVVTGEDMTEGDVTIGADVQADVPATTGGGSSGGCASTTSSNSASSLLIALALAALFFFRRFRG